MQAREQISERSNNISEESALTSQNSTKQQDLALFETDEKKIDAEMAPLSGQLDVLIQDHAEAESLLKKSHSLQPDLERIRSEVLALTSTYDETSKKSEQSNMELNEVNASVEEASNIAKEVELEKNENDKAEEEVMLPAIAKKSDAIKEKEQLAGEVANMHKKIMETEDANQDIASTFGTKQSALIAKLKEIKEKLEQSRHEFEELEHKAASDEATGLESIKEVKDFSSKFEEATKAEISRLEEMKRQRVDERVEKLEKRRSNLASIEDARFREIDAIKQGLDLIKEVKVIETTLRETDVVLDENVEDSMQWPEYKHAFESTGSYTNSSSEAVHAIHGNDYDDAQASVCGEAASPTAKRR